MPLYEYHCRTCEETFEKLQRQPEQEVPCPHCGKPAKRTVSLFSGATESGGGGCASPAGSGFG